MSNFFAVVILVFISYLFQVESKNSVKQFPERVDLVYQKASIIKDNKWKRNYRSANPQGLMVIGDLIPTNCQKGFQRGVLQGRKGTATFHEKK